MDFVDFLINLTKTRIQYAVPSSNSARMRYIHIMFVKASPWNDPVQVSRFLGSNGQMLRSASLQLYSGFESH